MLFAARFDIPEGNLQNNLRYKILEGIWIQNPNKILVCIFFNEKLLRGNRAIKMDSTGLTAFETPNFSPLANLEEIYWWKSHVQNSLQYEKHVLRYVQMRPFPRGI